MNRLIIIWFLMTTVFGGILFIKSGLSQEDQSITLDFPKNRELNLEVFVDFVQSNLEIPLAYDPSIFKGDSSKLTIKPNGLNQVSKAELYQLLNNTLRIRGLAIVKDSRTNDPYYTIKPIRELRPLVPHGRSKDFKSGDIFTEVFSIAKESSAVAKKYVESFYPNDNRDRSPLFVTELTDRNELIVTGFKRDMMFVEDIIRRFNGQSDAITRSYYEVQHIDLEELSTLLNSVMGTENHQKSKTHRSNVKSDFRVIPQESRNRLLLIGSSQQIAYATKIIGEMDIPNSWVIHSYLPREISAKRLDEIIRNLLTGSNLSRQYRSVVDDSKNKLIVKTTPTIHRQLQDLVDQYDHAAKETTQSRGAGLIRTYKLKNVKAKDVLNTIRSIEKSAFGRRFIQTKGARSLNQISDLTNELWQPIQNSPSMQHRGGVVQKENLEGESHVTPGEKRVASDQRNSLGSQSRRHLIPGEATVESFGNTIIVVAEPHVQSLYARLIHELDKRTPQVLIEATVVSIDCADDYALGVEISGGDRVGARKVLAFSSFGLSRADPITGALSLIPGVGFNGTLVDPDAADAVLRALANHRKARVVSAPKILVNDNSEGELSSISEVPFTSVNASNTVSTTSFAGFAEAGTSIRVLPNISEGDHVNLDFSVTVNDFSGPGVDGIPPPRQTDDVSSQVTIPDGHTVIVGGLRRKRSSTNESFLPGFEHLSILKLLGGSHAKGSGDELLFVFLKPIILRDDKFRDLRFLSDREIGIARIPADLPQSQPIIIR